MSITNAVVISEFYLDELDSRKMSLNHFLEQIDECEQLLKEIPRFKSFSHLAERTERHLRQLQSAKQHFLKDRRKLEEIEKKLYDKEVPVGNSRIPPAIDEELENIWQDELNLDTSFLQVRTCCRKYFHRIVVDPKGISDPVRTVKKQDNLVSEREIQEVFILKKFRL
jgi:hypothetical protein